MAKQKESLTLEDLAEQGLALTKDQATRLLPHISKISQHGSTGLNEVEFEETVLSSRQPDFDNTPNLTSEDNGQHGGNNGYVNHNGETDGGIANIDRRAVSSKPGEEQTKQGREDLFNKLNSDEEVEGKAKEKNELREKAEGNGLDDADVKNAMDQTDANDQTEKKQAEGIKDGLKDQKKKADASKEKPKDEAKK